MSLKHKKYHEYECPSCNRGAKYEVKYSSHGFYDVLDNGCRCGCKVFGRKYWALLNMNGTKTTEAK